METEQQQYHSHLFMVRLWNEELGNRSEWRGRVQHVTSGETRYFRDWAELIAFLSTRLQETDSP